MKERFGSKEERIRGRWESLRVSGGHGNRRHCGFLRENEYVLRESCLA